MIIYSKVQYDSILHTKLEPLGDRKPPPEQLILQKFLQLPLSRCGKIHVNNFWIRKKPGFVLANVQQRLLILRSNLHVLSNFTVLCIRTINCTTFTLTNKLIALPT